MTSQQIQYGGRPPYWKSSFGYISTSDYLINAKFCRIKQNHVLTQDTWPKYQISKIQDGGRPPFWIWFYRYRPNSAGNHPISAQFSVLAQVTLPGTVTWQSGRILQIQHRFSKSFFGYILEMGKNRHLMGSVLFGFYKYQGSVRFGFLSVFKWSVLVLFGFYDYHGSVRVRVLLGNVTFIRVIIYKLTINVFLKLQDCWV